jgi:hypothetical protein
MTNPRQDAHPAVVSNLAAAVTGSDRRTLDEIFRHPLLHNLSWREVVTLFTAIGEAEEKHNGEFVFRVGAEHLSMKRPHDKDLTGPDVMDVRHFLTRTGWSPDASASPRADFAPPSPSLIVVIDHVEAKIYRIDRSIDGSHGVAASDTRHMSHHLERNAHDEDRDETYPNDERFFERIADAVSAGGDIVVIGHGKGQSNEADHLCAYLQAHHKLTYARIMREIVADLPHLSTPELLELGRHAFGR